LLSALELTSDGSFKEMKGFRIQVSGVSETAGPVAQFDRKKKLINVEHRTSNIEFGILSF